MAKNNEKRIEQIYNDRKMMLEMVKNGLENGNQFVCSNIEQINTLLDIDDKNTKEYKAIIQAKEIINNLMIEINNCQSVEEIVKIRKKLNYYINKIKKQLVSRGLDEKAIDDYKNNTSYLRKNISKYISYLKREDKITKINEFNSLGENISKDDLVKLRKLISNEKRYNRNFLNKEIVVNNNEKKEVKEDVLADFIKQEKELAKKSKKKTEDIEFFFDDIEEKKNDEPLVFTFDDIEEKKTNTDNEDLVFISDEEENVKNEDASIDFVFDDDGDNKKNTDDDSLVFIFDDDEDKVKDNDNFIFGNKDMFRKSDGTFDAGKFVDAFKKHIKEGCERINQEETMREEKLKKSYNFYGKRYGLVDPNKYGNSVAGNLVVFCSNVPRYVMNKAAIKDMKKDYNYYLGVETLSDYIEYSSKRNSIKRAFKQVFDHSFLVSHENECLDNHEKCLEWITKYSNMANTDDNDKTLTYAK